MIFKETDLKGAFLIEMELLEDERGFFSRSFCREEFKRYGLNTEVAQCNVSYNKKKGTLRGIHFQMAPKEEAKLVRCVKGAVYDVIIDLRPDSDTYCRWRGVELNSQEYKELYIPEGFAHGFQTLEDNTELFYQMFEVYDAGLASGVRYNDPAFGIKWPLPDPIISKKDRSYPLFEKVTQ